MALAKRADWNAAGTEGPLGFATPGTTEDQALWRLLHRTFNDEGDFSDEYADGDSRFDNVWDDRAGLSYP